MNQERDSGDFFCYIHLLSSIPVLFLGFFIIFLRHNYHKTELFEASFKLRSFGIFPYDKLDWVILRRNSYEYFVMKRRRITLNMVIISDDQFWFRWIVLVPWVCWNERYFHPQKATWAQGEIRFIFPTFHTTCLLEKCTFNPVAKERLMST